MNKAGPAPVANREQRKIHSETLLRGHRTLVIVHRGERYTLRVTASDKLILTK